MDGGFEIFLLLMFVFWILEGIAKAKQRPRVPRPPDQNMPGPTSEQISAQSQRAPTQRGQRPPTLLELLAAELERARESQRKAEEAAKQRAESPVSSQVDAPQKPVEWLDISGTSAPKKAPPKRGQPIARRTPPRGTEPSRTAARRPPLGPKGKSPARTRLVRPDLRAGAAAEPGESDFADDLTVREGQTSDTWASGERDAERGSSREAERVAALETERSASLEATPRRSKLQRAAIKETQQPIAAAKKQASKPAAHSLEPHHLIGASPAELRRILVLQEVLGPPVALREDREA
jgi:hypothetical protein